MKDKISIRTAIAIVVANMIGTGVFTSLGFQLSSLHNTWTIVLLWSLGGLLGLCGAFAYAELGTRYPHSGGDYIYLSRVFHPALGYLSGWACLTVGFSAPLALAAMAFTKYLAPFGMQNNPWLAIALLVLIGFMHSFTVSQSSRFHNISTVVKVVFIVVLIVIGLGFPAGHPNALRFDEGWGKEILSPGFAVSMVYVSFAYTGWNSSAYLVEEISRPRRNLPRSLIISTAFVTVVYVLFQVVLLRQGARPVLVNKEEVSFVAFSNLLGATGGKWVSIFIAIQLVATISSYTWVGPRVASAMARDYRLWRPLSKKNRHEIPVAAIWAHVALASVLALTGSFEKVLLYSGLVLQLMTSLTVFSSLFIKGSDTGNFTTPLKPLPQIIFLLFNAAVLTFTAISRPFESLWGLGILAIGLLLYRIDKRMTS